ncbi:MAG TPA: GNAT family N-acetyltransferase [Gammaproteobacteria bacterium]
MTPANDNINIREAVAEDAVALTELYRLLKVDPNIQVQPGRLIELRADPGSFLIVCEAGGGKPVGTVHVTLFPDAMYGNQPFAVLENIVIAEASRSRGIGTMLMNHVEEFCFSRGCSKIMLLSNAQRGDAHRFFSRAGYSSSKKVGFVKYRGDYNPQTTD